MLFLAGCGSGSPKTIAFSEFREVDSFPLSRFEKDVRPPFKLELKKPFQIEFGRGSGWHGLETIKLGNDGRVEVYRRDPDHRDSWVRADLTTSQNSLAEVVKAVDDCHLLSLHKGYHANVADGTQWVLWFKQGQNEKSIYFNNHFPAEIQSFAKLLDAVLSREGLDKATWQNSAGRQHEKELWESIKR